jgi:hypothetical protein
MNANVAKVRQILTTNSRNEGLRIMKTYHLRIIWDICSEIEIFVGKSKKPK